ncbi:MAG: hypothetical protein HC860_26325 [Alkalinema sp. RU_4_3]|nr:hypothetical protein [Alkalinema sp. RU_4_3]
MVLGDQTLLPETVGLGLEFKQRDFVAVGEAGAEAFPEASREGERLASSGGLAVEELGLA